MLHKSSRDLQWIQHIVGGLSTITLQMTGVFAGMSIGNVLPWYVPAIMFVVSFTLQRISSEVSYQTSVRIFQENKKE